MKTLIASGMVLGGMLMLPAAASAQGTSSTTKADYVACTTYAAYKEQNAILASGDQSGWSNYIASGSNGCFWLKDGVRVVVASGPGIGVIKIRPASGTSWYYTAREAVR